MTETAKSAFAQPVWTPESVAERSALLSRGESQYLTEPLIALSGLPALPGLMSDEEGKPWISPETQRKVATVAGVAIAFTSVGTVVDLLNQTPQYEGTFSINPALTTATEGGDSSRTGSDRAATARRATTPAPTVDLAEQSRVLRSPRFINPVVERLKATDPSVSYDSIVDGLEVRIGDASSANGSQEIEIAYRNSDPARVKQVLDELAQSYVTQSLDCQDSRCRGLEFIESRLPGLQQRIQTLRQQIQALQQQNSTQTMQNQVRLLTAREGEVARQKIQLDGYLLQARQQYAQAQQRLGVRPGEAIASQLLNQDTRYQAALAQYRQVNAQITQEFSRLDNSSNLRALYVQHQQLLTQLQQEAGQVVTRYLSTPKPQLQDPIFQNKESLQQLQQAVGTTYTLHVLESRQQMVTQLQSRFSQVRQQVVGQLRQYDRLQNEFATANQILQQYLDEQQQLSNTPATPQLTWQVAAEPQLLADESGQPVSLQSSELPWEVGVGATVGIALGVGTAAMMNRKGKLNNQKSQPVWSLAEGQALLPADNKRVHNRSRVDADTQSNAAEVEENERSIQKFPEAIALR